jgi:hypothetical protein
MTAIAVSKVHPRPVEWARFCRNGQIPQAALYVQTAKALNHGLRFRRKCVFNFASRAQAINVGSGSTTERWHFRCRVGWGAYSLVFVTVMAREENEEFPAASDPYVEWAVKLAGGATTTTDPIRYGLGPSTAGEGPSQLSYAVTEVPVTAGSTYECKLTAYDNARPCSCVVYEVALQPDTGTSLYVKQAYSVRQPIHDADREQLLANLTDMLKKNAAQLWWWSKDVSGLSRSSATHANVMDSTTSVSSASVGSTLNLEYRNTFGRTTIPVTFAVKASTAAGSAGKVRLQTSSGTLVGITTIGTTNQWYTTTANISASSSLKFDLQFAGDGTNAVTIEAACLYVDE